MAKIALYLDEDVHPTLAQILRERGFDVLTTAEAGRTLKLLAALSAEEMVNRLEWLSNYR